MQAAVYEGSGKLTVKDIATPMPGPGEVLIRVDSDTICGTDLRIASGTKSKGVYPPVVLGHELAGTVHQLGDGVTGLQIGDRVGMTPSIACTTCKQCQLGNYNLCAKAQILGHDVDGGLAEYFLASAQAVAEGNLVPAPAGLAPEEVSLAEPLSCVLHGQELMGLAKGDVVVVIGGGAIGQMHAQVARVRGAKTVIVSEPVQTRRELALKLGADIVVDPTKEDLAAIVDQITGGAGADAMIVCIGVPGLVGGALQIAGQRAKVCLFAGFPNGVPSEIDPNIVHYRELKITGSSNSTVQEYRDALQLIAKGGVDVKSLITHRFPLEQIEQALAMAVAPDALKVAVIPG